ncbi:hypothetical protein HII13_000311 [Brettanomyces bruxellensis]|nr:hypothetical protein HII13_000311 [Brettanomyces bruxellensis]
MGKQLADLEAHPAHVAGADRFTMSAEQLESFYDPKSMKKLMEVGGIEAIAKHLASNLSSGLDASGEDFEARRSKYGTNMLPSKPSKSFLALCWEQLHDQVLIILSVAAVVSLALGLYETFGQPTVYDAEGKSEPKVEWVEGVAIIVAIAIVVLVSAVNDYNKERQFAKLNAKKEDRQIVVFRSGQKHFISINDLLVGDVVAVETGDVVPADSILVKGECECDESSLTGETNTVRKTRAGEAERDFMGRCQAVGGAPVDIGDRPAPGAAKVQDPVLISGSKLLSGQGRALVTAVGVHSMHGKIMMSLRHESEETPLQKRLTNLANGISKYGFMVAVVLFVVLFIKFLAALGGSYKDLSSAEKGTKFLNIVITAITIVVVAIPEGLPLAVTLALAFATTRMTKDGNLVRVLKSCETMGSATAVCSDKTGTLTENRMKVVRGVLGTTEFDDRGEENGKKGVENTPITSKQAAAEVCKAVVDSVSENALLNSTAFEGESAEEPFVGSKTECALLQLCRDGLGTIDASIQSIRDRADARVVQVVPFESSRKWGGLVVRMPGSGGADSWYRLYVKGASELVVSRCGYRAESGGRVVRLDGVARRAVGARIAEYAGGGVADPRAGPPGLSRGRAVATADPEKLFGEEMGEKGNLQNDDNGDNTDFQSKDVPSIVINDTGGLVLDALVGIQDPLRPGVADAIAQCERAGVRVRMVTGDNVLTARAISQRCGILDECSARDQYSCMEGPAFRALSAPERLKVVPRLHVLARSSPEDKRVLVETLKQLGEVVAVTGDGTNDAPALKLADVGFSMGVSGTEVAREASDIILMTDDFASIVDAIKWGRTVSTSIRKFVQFQLTVNITACVLTFVSAVASSDGSSVLTAVQLLWVNLIMDTLAALALATDKPDADVLNRPPMGRHAALISTSMWKMILGQSAMQLTVTMILHFAGDALFFGSNAHPSSHQRKQVDSLTFNTFVWLQVFKLFVTRKLDEGDGLTRVRERISRRNLDFFQNLFRNGYFIAIELLISGFQVLIMFVGGAAFSIARQTAPMWATALLCGLISFPLGWIVRIVPDVWVEAVFPTAAFRRVLDWAEFGPLRRAVGRLRAARRGNAAEHPSEAHSGSSDPIKLLDIPQNSKKRTSFSSHTTSLSAATNASSSATSDTLVKSSASSLEKV